MTGFAVVIHQAVAVAKVEFKDEVEHANYAKILCTNNQR